MFMRIVGIHVSMYLLEMYVTLVLCFVQHLLVRHILDVMHCEKNLCENLLKTLFGMNDSPGSRVDAEELGIREEIWLQPPRRQQEGYYMPHAPYVFRPNERAEFVGIVSNIRTPTNYVGSIHKRLADGKLQYMKTHDYHVLMQQVRNVSYAVSVYFAMMYECATAIPGDSAGCLVRPHSSHG